MDEVLGFLLMIAALLTALALLSHVPQDPAPFFSSSTGENVTPGNWIGGFGAMWSRLLLTLFGFTAWLVAGGLAVWGYERFRGRRFENPGTKVVGILLMAISLPALLSLLIGASLVRGETLEAGGLIGAGIARFARSHFNTVGSAILLSALLVLSIPLATQVSLAETLMFGRVRLAAFFGRFSLGLSRKREHRIKERLKKEVVLKHIEKTRHTDAVSAAPPAAAAQGPTPSLRVREVEGEGRFSVRRVTASVPSGPAGTVLPGREKKKPSPQQDLFKAKEVGGYLYPQSSLLQKYDPVGTFDRKQLPEIARRITEKCAEFGVEGEVVEFHPGPVVTTYEFRPAAGIKVNQVMSMSEDLALALSAESIRIERIAGRSSVGIEIPNPDGGDMIALRDVIESERFAAERSLLALALGKDIHGEPLVANLQSMPHLLIAGTTGSGKSVGINTIITSILFKSTPEEVKLILIDPKMVELEIYKDIPHLLTPIVTEPKKASNALKWAVAKMDERYQLLSKVGGVRNIDQYNRALKDDKHLVDEVRARHPDEELEIKPLPYIVIVIDELADLMMTAPKDVEESIARLAQKARAVGIHLVVATQRPSTDVLTGVIKANLPSRIAFKVATKIDSRVVLDGNGAEKLLGRGDMLYLGPGTSRLHRVHGAYISVEETAAIVKFLKKQARPEFDAEVTRDREEENRISAAGIGESDEADSLYDEAARLVVKERMASISFLQRRMGVGFSRAGKLIDMMNRDGLLGPQKGSKPREVLVPEDYFDAVDKQAR